MRIRKLATATSTIVVAIIVALTVPVSQLRTLSVVTTCCCPDPAHCHCPDHGSDHSTLPSMRACHKDVEITTPAPAPVAVAAIVVIELPARSFIGLVEHAIPSPHVPPNVDRPDGPS